MIILGCDPGTTMSSFVAYDGRQVVHSIELPNADALGYLANSVRFHCDVDAFAIEQIEAMGMAVGREVFETVWWSGRFVQASPFPFHRITRRAVKMHLCGTMRAKDANIRAALMDRFGGAGAVGTKKAQGPLYGIAAHKWSALAVALTCRETSNLTATSRPDTMIRSLIERAKEHTE